MNERSEEGKSERGMEVGRETERKREIEAIHIKDSEHINTVVWADQ